MPYFKKLQADGFDPEVAGPLTVMQINKFNWLKGGSEAMYINLMELLRLKQHKVVAFSMKHELNMTSEYSRYFVENVDYTKGGILNKLAVASKIIYSLDARSKMRALLDKIRPDIAHFHNFQHQISPSVFSPLREAGVPIVVTLHDLKAMCPNYKMMSNGAICEKCKGRRFYNCFLNRCIHDSALKGLIGTVEMYFHYLMGYYQGVDMYISPSRFIKDKMVEYGFSEDRITHIPNFIDPDLFPFSSLDGGYALYFGRLSTEKGVATLLEALAMHKGIRCLIAGGGPMEGELQKMASRLGLKNLAFLGHRSGDDLKKLVGSASFTVIPSECYENCPMSLLESLSMGKGVIGARIGGIPELISEGDDGLTFESGNAEELGEKMRLLWESPKTRSAMGKNGRDKIVRRYTPQIYYDQLMKAYKNVLGASC